MRTPEISTLDRFGTIADLKGCFPWMEQSLMDIFGFRRDVVVSLGPPGNTRTAVTNVVDAVGCLTLRWPVTSGQYYWAAQETCLAVFDGSKSANDARSAFLRAANEADVIVWKQ
ncbi:DUF982 domain-containing protein [Rhizobium lusitanum]|uniref:DUF982 domain-containing protein n=1 Tax=Rhizobium lusitanum TaxID=293958 RepID=UPI001957E5CD|nr:DUF982 domain-containing protein [Rhizobium lusitanum]MBM7045702.1 DUF982 domain-containing protein [Rhizobium lusitanum]